MTLIRPTRSLARRLSVCPGKQEEVPLECLTEWYANDFRLGRAEFVLFVNPTTCLPIVMKAAPYRDLPSRFRDELPEHLKGLGWVDAHQKLGAELAGEIQFARTHDRSTLGVMVEFVKQLEADHEAQSLDLESLPKMSRRLADILVGGPNYQKPIERFRKTVGISSAPSGPYLRLVT